MGITCKEIGKFGGMLRKIKNEKEKERKVENRKKSKNNNENKE